MLQEHKPYLDIDKQRFRNQEDKVLPILLDYKRHTLSEISQLTGIKEGSVGSRIRDLRVRGYIIERKRKGNVHYYSMKHPEYEQGDLFNCKGR
jgi:biotin operon repressor